MSNKRRGGDTEGQFDYDDDEDEEFDGFDEVSASCCVRGHVAIVQLWI
jgi:hypothetical protein